MKIANFHQVLAPIAACTATLLLLASPLAHADESQEVAKLYRQGNLAQALTRADAYLTSRPKDAQMRFHKGLILAEQNKIADAIKIFSSLSADYPNLPEPYNNLAVLYANQGQYEKAKGALEAAIRTHPSYSTAHENLGDIYAKMASQAYDKALQLDKSNAAAQTKLTLIKDLFTDVSKGVKIATTTSASTPPAKGTGENCRKNHRETGSREASSRKTNCYRKTDGGKIHYPCRLRGNYQNRERLGKGVV